MLSDGRLKLTLLVPTNKAVMALARKPCVSFRFFFFRVLKDVGIDVLIVDFRHQGMDDVDDGVEVSEEEFDSRSKSNVEHWVSVHVIPVRFNLKLLAMGLIHCIYRKRLYLWTRGMRLCCAESRSLLHPYRRMMVKGQSGAV